MKSKSKSLLYQVLKKSVKRKPTISANEFYARLIPLGNILNKIILMQERPKRRLEDALVRIRNGLNANGRLFLDEGELDIQNSTIEKVVADAKEEIEFFIKKTEFTVDPECLDIKDAIIAIHEDAVLDDENDGPKLDSSDSAGFSDVGFENEDMEIISEV